MCAFFNFNNLFPRTPKHFDPPNTAKSREFHEFFGVLARVVSQLERSVYGFVEHVLEKDNSFLSQESLQIIAIKFLISVTHSCLDDLESHVSSSTSLKSPKFSFLTATRPSKDSCYNIKSGFLTLLPSDEQFAAHIDRRFVKRLDQQLTEWDNVDWKLGAETRNCVKQHFQQICRSKSHPLGVAISRLLAIARGFSQRVLLDRSHESLKQLSRNIKQFINSATYKILDMYPSLQNIKNSRELIMFTLEKSIIEPLHPTVFLCYGLKNEVEDRKLREKQKTLFSYDMEAIGISPKFCINPTPSSPGYTSRRESLELNVGHLTLDSVRRSPSHDFLQEQHFPNPSNLSTSTPPLPIRVNTAPLPTVQVNTAPPSPRTESASKLNTIVNEFQHGDQLHVRSNSEIFDDTKHGKRPRANSLPSLNCSQPHAHPPNMSALIPYWKVIRFLAKIPTKYTPTEKLKCLTDACQEICRSASKHHRNSSFVREHMGCDELIPILSYCLVKAVIPHLQSELQFIQDFVDETESLGHEGFCFASLLCAVVYLGDISPAKFKSIAEEESQRMNSQNNGVDEQKEHTSTSEGEDTRPERAKSEPQPPHNDWPTTSRSSSIASSSRASSDKSNKMCFSLRCFSLFPTYQTRSGRLLIGKCTISTDRIQMLTKIADDTFKNVMRAADPDRLQLDNWSEKLNQDGVAVYRRLVENDAFHCIKGVTEIKAPPQEVVKVVWDPTNSRHYNEAFVKAHTLEVVNNSTKIVRLYYKPTKWCIKIYRSFTMLQQYRILKNGTCVAFATSVDDLIDFDDKETKYVSEHVHFAAWVCRPCASPQKSEVAYLMQLDTLDSVPAFIQNPIIDHQVLLVRDVRSLFEPV